MVNVGLKRAIASNYLEPEETSCFVL